MKKLISLFMALVCLMALNAKTIYLNAGGSNLWDQGGAVFFAHSWEGTDSNVKDLKLGLIAAGVYSVDVPDGNSKIIFVRMPNGSQSLNWDSKWNQTDDLEIPADKDCFTITGWGEGEGAKSVGTWSKYEGATTLEYYLAGSGFPGASWAEGEHLKMTDGTINFSDLPKGEYKFKVTNNTWSFSLGAAAVDASCSSQGYSSDNDGNVVVVFAKDGGKLTVTVADGKLCVEIQGETEVPYSGSAVPSQCGDVMMQGFYYDSYEVDTAHWATDIYGDTKWMTLLKQAGEIGAYFDLIWLPPSAYASGTGYHPKQYSNQNSDWGSRTDLEKLIAALHNSGTKVIADIVINHVEAMASWCDFAVQDFGEYGVFQPDGSYICNTDEMNNEAFKKDAGECFGTATGKPDDGENWEAARDWSHSEVKVQEMFKAYLKWMKNVIGYDGWRYDKGDGFNNWHMSNYNNASQPYIAFEERYDGNAANVRRGIEEAEMNIMALDFPAKFNAINPIAGWNYVGRQGLIGNDDNGSDYWKKHAVTWVENHDMFMRRDNELEFGGRGNSMTEDLKFRLLGANAFILSMPGVPCIFYPHWFKYKEELKPMINARHLAGVHSESVVKDEEWDWNGERNAGYKATVVGKNGWLILCLGTKVTNGAGFDGYKLIASGYNTSKYGPVESYEIWVNATGDVAPGIICTPSATFEDLENGINVEIKAVGGSGNAKIYYTTDGNDPTTASTVYTTKLNFKQTTTLKVMAVCGSAKSKVQTYTYTYREPLKRGIQVRFNKPAEWQKVYYYAWLPGVDEQGNVTSENIVGAYPGKRIYQDADGWYTYEFDPELKELNFCISSGNDCGGVNVRSNDLQITYDACYGWREGKETESKEEEVLDCETNLHPDFDLILAPESGYFRDLTEGQEVTIHTVGAPNAMIYYTTDGSEPTTGSKSGQGEVTFKVNQTTTVKAYAAQDKERTPTYSATYTYKAPRQGAMTVKFIKPDDWADLYLYAFTRVKVGGRDKDTPYALDGTTSKWPGIKWTQTDGQWYTYTMPEELKDIYVIFNIGSNEIQTQDIYMDESACFLWNPECWRAVQDNDCDGKMDDAVENIIKDTPALDPAQPMYNILGQRVGKSYMGFVIQNGHKYLIIR